METNRVTGLDAARASMMLFGVFLHVVLFSRGLLFDTADPARQTILGLYFTGHAFRLPTFFVLAGFFASLLIAKRGPKEFLRNRARRLGLVMLLVAPVLIIVTLAVSGRIDNVRTLHFWLDRGLLHFWFVYFLVIYSVLAYLFTFIRIPERLSTVSSRVGVWMSNPLILWIAPLALVVAPSFLTPGGRLRASVGLIPDLAVLGFYGLLFAVGALLHHSGQSGLEALARRGVILTLIGLVAAQFSYGWGTDVVGGTVKEFLSILASVYLTLGVIGIFVRFVTNTGPVWGYFARTSYWVYLAHPPFVYLLLRWLAPLGIAPVATLLIVFVVSVALSLASFEILVRRTPLARLV